jgi:hypothetical protein
MRLGGRAYAAIVHFSFGALLVACPEQNPSAVTPRGEPSASASGVTSASALPATTVAPPVPTAPLSEDADGEALFTAYEKDAPFPIRFEGPPLEGYLSKKPCAYFEWTHGEGRELASPVRGWQSDGQLVAVARIGGLPFRIGFSWRKLRPYLAPSFEREARLGDPWVPSNVREDLGKATRPIWVVEHCLEIGADYWARVNVETYTLPSRVPGQPPVTVHSRVLLVSDRPFVDGRPVGQVTPGFRAWSY